MNILILTVGSRGDVQPYVALGQGLRAAGHRVILSTLAGFAEMVQAAELEFAPLRGEFLELMQTSEGRAAMAGKANIFKLVQMVQPMYRTMLEDEYAASEDADLIIYHPKALGGHSIAEQRGIPAILALPLPLYSPTRAFPSPALPMANLGGMLNKASHRMVVALATSSVRGTLNRWRREQLELGPLGDELVLHGRPLLRLYAYSPMVLPTPDDWDSFSVATGYWFLEQPGDWQPAAELVGFLRAGPPPVYIGFGSMAAQDAQAKTRIVLDALRIAGQRGILASGWGGLSTASLPEGVYMLDAAPHDWLFPQMAAVVHHGGAGTTAAGLLAGRPTIICPFFADQPFWGRRVAELGAGPQPIPQKKLNATNLAAAITQAVSDPAMGAAAEAIGAQLRQEDGIGRAVELINAHMAALGKPVAVEA
ncbi:MAG: glycosyltransferase family 1 protein [Oscillochloris sp.]|nr:glycosyltransferase family 1 protein [Oscillochloris sp.]